jgi:hypothetical protein
MKGVASGDAESYALEGRKLQRRDFELAGRVSCSDGFEGCLAVHEWLDVIDLRCSDDPVPI